MIQMARKDGKATESKSRMENPEFAQMMARFVRTYERRLSAADPSDLMDALAIAAQMDDMIGRAVRAQREAHGFSWAEVAAELGVTRQAAQQRWGKAKG
jgi:uncharacterized protein with PIN domain